MFMALDKHGEDVWMKSICRWFKSFRTGVVSKIGFQLSKIIYLMVYLFSHWNPYGTWSINRAIPHFETPPQRRLLRSDCWSSATTRAPKLGMAAVHMLSGWWMRWCRTAEYSYRWYLSGGIMCCFSWWALAATSILIGSEIVWKCLTIPALWWSLKRDIMMISQWFLRGAPCEKPDTSPTCRPRVSHVRRFQEKLRGDSRGRGRSDSRSRSRRRNSRRRRGFGWSIGSLW